MPQKESKIVSIMVTRNAQKGSKTGPKRGSQQAQKGTPDKAKKVATHVPKSGQTRDQKGGKHGHKKRLRLA